MINILKTINNNKLINKNDKIGVAVSGGIDSMCLLHFLNSIKKDFKFSILAINIDHQIRENSAKDSMFVKDFCKQNNIPCHTFKVDALNYSKTNKLTLEEGARLLRYGVFDSLISKKIVDKIAIAHHHQDQVETILLNLLRGTGLKGAQGMEYKRDGFIRPMLDVTKQEILCYQQEYNLPFVEDETNQDTRYSRNFLREQIIPLLKNNWKNFDNNLINFSKICKQDDDYINSTISYDNLVLEKTFVKIPLNMFVYSPSVINRVIRYSLDYLKALKDIENKHLNIITKLALESENGTKIHLPNNLIVHKEYDYITISLKKQKQPSKTLKFKIGKTKFENSVEIVVKKQKDLSNLKQERTHVFDYDKLPSKAVWRTRQNGDVFTKFSGGSKKLKDYFIDKKIPQRLRNEIPLLCVDNEVLIVLGVEISEKLKVDSTTKTVCSIKF